MTAANASTPEGLNRDDPAPRRRRERLRRRAATADITIAEAARQLMQPTDVQHPLGLLEYVAWLHTRLLRRRDDLVSVLEDGNADPKAVDEAIDSLAGLLKEWPVDDPRRTMH